MDGLDPDVVDLQLRFMKLERELAELSGIVAAQQRTLEALRLEVLRRRERQGSEERNIEDERPPHY